MIGLKRTVVRYYQIYTHQDYYQTVREGKTERERETETERDRERETDRQTDRQRGGNCKY